MKRRILSIITALALCLSLCPTWAFAAEADPALCPHHPAHTGECGYIAPTEGQPCGHEHNDVGLLVERNGTAVLSGGTFTGRMAIGVHNDASVTLKGLLAEGYAYHRNDLPITKAEGWVDSSTWGEVSLDTKANLAGPVTVKQCEHNGEGVCAYVHNENTSTHTETCLACGNAKDAETCSYDATTGRCACGSTLAVTLPADLKLTYDGTAKEPAVTVTLDGTVLTAEHYTVVYANNKDAGTATVTVNGTAPYTFTKELTFSIAKKPVTAVVTAADKTYDGTPNATMSATVTEGILSGDSITISGVTGTFVDENVGTDKTVTVNTTNASVTGTNAENYDVHYPETVTASITPIEVTLTFADQTIIYGETVTKATANVNGVKIVYSYTGTATGNDWPTNAGTYTVTAKVEATGNYGEASKTITLTINPKAVSTPTIELSDNSFIYDGTEKKPAVVVKDGTTVSAVSGSGNGTSKSGQGRKKVHNPLRGLAMWQAPFLFYEFQSM